ncbi:MAG: hypothetical protein R3242_01080 [Akkermansiaceae bacterium]|nr:hypothetical protein [Akkermansiaceae bacterium]
MTTRRFYMLPMAFGLLMALVAQIDARTCRIVFPERPDAFPDQIHLFDGSNSHAIRVPSRNLSPVLELPDGKITISLTENPVAGAAEIPQTAPHLVIPEKITDLYLLVTPKEGAGNLSVNLLTVDASDAQLKPGETLWLNLTDTNVQANLGDSRVLIDAKRHITSQKPVDKSGYYEAHFFILKGEDEEPQAFARQSWWHDVDSRHFGLIMDNGGKLPMIMIFRDFRAPEAPESE